jgi:hypothetical protein
VSGCQRLFAQRTTAMPDTGGAMRKWRLTREDMMSVTAASTTPVKLSVTADYVTTANNLPSVVALPKEIDHRSLEKVFADPFVKADVPRFVRDVLIDGPKTFELGPEATMTVAYELGKASASFAAYTAFIEAFAPNCSQPAFYENGYKSGLAGKPCPSYIDQFRALHRFMSGTFDVTADKQVVRDTIEKTPRLRDLQSRGFDVERILTNNPDFIGIAGKVQDDVELVIANHDARDSTIQYQAYQALICGYKAVSCAPENQALVSQLLKGSSIAVRTS